MNALNHTSDFVNVNGIRLHYLDWGGKGPALIFLAGMGSSAYIFNKFAPRFTDKFRVLALTRRGHGDSDYPETGYDADTLIEDIRQFMDCLKIETASLAGHSLAGVELTHFAATHPERVEKLIYLEALDDRRREQVMHAQNPLNTVEIKQEESAPPRSFEEYIAGVKRDVPEFAAIWSDLWDEELSHGVTVNEDGIYVDRMPAFVEEAIVENLIKATRPQEWQLRFPRSVFTGSASANLRRVHRGTKSRVRKLHSRGQGSRPQVHHRRLSKPLSSGQDRRDPRRTSLLLHRPRAAGL